MSNVGPVTEPDLHPACQPLRSLLGTWRGSGSGHYPTIEDFEYLEEVAFGHVGKPFVSYGQRTRHARDGVPLHAEQGYLRPQGDDGVELVIAQPSGIVEVHAGTLAATTTGVELHLHTIEVVTTPSAKHVASVERSIRVDGDTLAYDLSMGAMGQPHQHHLAATLTRVE